MSGAHLHLVCICVTTTSAFNNCGADLLSSARPYEDPLIDLCEFFSLVSTLFIALSAIVFAVLDDPAHPNMQDNARFVSRLCEVMSMVMVVANCVLGLVIEIRVWVSVVHGEEDYKVKMTKQALQAAEDDVVRLKDVLNKAEENATLMQASRSELKEKKEDTASDETRIENPLSTEG